MSDPLQALLRALDLAPLGDDRFEGRSVEATRKRMFGGELIAQGLIAASRTAEGRDCHSLHCNFLLPGDPAKPIEYRVRRLRDGKRFAQRQAPGQGVIVSRDGHLTQISHITYANPTH